MEKDKIKSIQNEINELIKIRSKWINTIKSKSQANVLVTEIKVVNHTFDGNFPNAIESKKRNSFAEINISDGIFNLKQYANSKLKNKDEHYFDDGIKNIRNGIDEIINYLENQIKY